MKNTLKHGFTLVELLVVMTVLSILWTFGYIAFTSNLAESRDAKREWDMMQIVNTLELYETENSEFPDPDDFVNITYSWSALAWKQGTFWNDVTLALKVFWSEVPLDPLFKNEYTYSVTPRNNEFQIAGIMETFEQAEWLWELAWLLTPETSAASIETAFVMWDYNGFMVQARENGVEYYIATPSIIATDISNPSVIDIITGQKLVYSEFFNLPHSYRDFVNTERWFNFNVSDPLIYQWNSWDLRSEDILLEFNNRLKYIYATTPTESFEKYISILEKDWLTSLKGFLTRKFKIPFESYFNCKDILDAWLADGDKMYTIDPDWPEWEDPYEVYCDMTTDGWWWTRVGGNQLGNADFAWWVWITWAIENDATNHEIIALPTPVDGNNFALRQTGNYSSNYEITLDDPSILQPGYEIRMSVWRSDYGSWAENTWASSTTLLAWKANNYTLWAEPYFSRFNSKMNNPANFWPWGNLTEIPITVTPMTSTITDTYLNGGILFDGFIPSADQPYPWKYSNAEIQEIDTWVQAGWFLLSTNDDSRFDPLWEFYSMPSGRIWENVSRYWEVQNIDHPLVNGSIWLGVDLRGQTLIWEQNYSALIWQVQPDDIVLARDKYSPFLPTVILRKHWKWHILITADEWIFRNMSPWNTFLAWDNEDAFAAAIMAYSIETVAGINPHEWYVFHNRTYYNDGTFSVNGEDRILETITVDDNGTPRVWSLEQVRHKVYKTPESFTWYLWLDANNNKDLRYTGLKLELFYR